MSNIQEYPINLTRIFYEKPKSHFQRMGHQNQFTDCIKIPTMMEEKNKQSRNKTNKFRSLIIFILIDFLYYLIIYFINCIVIIWFDYQGQSSMQTK